MYTWEFEYQRSFDIYKFSQEIIIPMALDEPPTLPYAHQKSSMEGACCQDFLRLVHSPI